MVVAKDPAVRKLTKITLVWAAVSRSAVTCQHG
jgi:hypothetical protein